MMNAQQQMMQALRSGSWMDTEKLAENAGQQLEKTQQQMRREAAIVKAALDNPQGEKFVQWLMSKTLLRAPSPEEQAAQSAESYAIAKARREGQNGVLFMILQALQMPEGETGQASQE